MARVLLPGAKPFPLNVVAVAYRFELGRYAQTKKNPPLEIEALVGTTKRGAPKPRLAVPLVLGTRLPHLLVLTVPPGIGATVLARAFSRSVPAVATVLDVAGALMTFFSVVVLGVAWVWSQVPDRRTGGYLRYPDRLWGASVGVLVVEALIGLLASGAV